MTIKAYDDNSKILLTGTLSWVSGVSVCHDLKVLEVHSSKSYHKHESRYILLKKIRTTMIMNVVHAINTKYENPLF